MEDKITEAKVIWMPYNDISFIVNEVIKCLGFQLIDVKELPQNTEYYEEIYSSFNCKILFNEVFEDCIQEIIHKWCNINLINNNHVWLSLKGIGKYHREFILADKQVEVENFSFGTIVNLNNFVEFYSSEEQNSNENLEYEVNEIECSFEHDCEKFSIYFVVSKKEINLRDPNSNINLPHRFEFDYSNISRMLINKVIDSDNLNIYLYLKYPPLIYGIEEPQKSDDIEDEDEISSTSYIRKVKFANCSELDISLSTILKLEISWYSAWEIVCNFVHSNKKIDCCISPISKFFKDKIYYMPQIKVNHFNCVFALESILSKNREIVVQINFRDELTLVEEKLNEFAYQNPIALENALFTIQSSLEKNNIVIFANALEVLFNKYQNDSNFNLNNPSFIRVRQAVLTPTRIIYLKSFTCFQCHLFREFNVDNIIQLFVRDENFECLTYSLREEELCNSNIILSIKNRLMDGFIIGQRKYEMLGYHYNMLKAHSIMFYSIDDCENNAKNIQNRLTSSSLLTDAVKHMKYMEQIFLPSLISLETDEINILKIDDMAKNSEFSGNGKISLELVKMICDKLEITYNPSAMKIYYEGFEYTLTVCKNLNGKQIVIRKSINSFIFHNSNLKILKISIPKLAYLNRSLVTILSQLNIKDISLLRLQESMVKNLIKCFIDEKHARYLFKINRIFYIDYEDLFDRFELLQEPFFRSLLQTITLKLLDGLKENTEILIPPKNGRTMLAILDETKRLSSGQVFVQYTEDIWNNDGKTVILTKPVLIARRTCIHPKDVQKFEAVDIPALHHIKDCIVFPANFYPPTMKELCEDEYLVIWMDDLIFPCQNYPSKEEPVSLPVSEKNIVDFFCDYIKNDKIDNLFTAFLISADKHTEGVFSDQCQNIIKRYSECLSFAKIGPFKNVVEEHFDDFPDFLDVKLEKNTYFSNKIVGCLYRRCEVLQLDFKEFINLENNIFLNPDPDLDYSGRENFEESANKALVIYQNKIVDILNEYGIETEKELLSYAISRHHKYFEKNEDLCDISIIYRIKMFVNEMREEFFKEFLKDGVKINTKIIDVLCKSKYKEKIFQKASAWYIASYNEFGGKKYFGLPWTIYEILNKLKLYNYNKSKERSLMFEKELEATLNLYYRINSEKDKFKIIVKIIHDLICNKILQSEEMNYEQLQTLLNCLRNYWSSNENINEQSFAKTFLLFLGKISCLIFETSKTLSCCLDSQALGRLALEVLLNLSYFHNIDYFQITSQMEPIQKAVFRLSLEQNELAERFTYFGDKITEIMLNWTNIKSFQYRLKEDNDKWYLLITVNGNKYTINYFKTIIMAKDFSETIINCISLQNIYD